MQNSFFTAVLLEKLLILIFEFTSHYGLYLLTSKPPCDNINFIFLVFSNNATNFFAKFPQIFYGFRIGLPNNEERHHIISIWSVQISISL